MNALSDSPTAPVNCILEPDDCTLSAACAQREVWRSVEEAIDGILNITTIGYMAAQQSQIVANIGLG